MATRDELHELLDYLPESALGSVLRILSVLYGNPKIVPPGLERPSRECWPLTYEEHRRLN